MCNFVDRAISTSRWKFVEFSNIGYIFCRTGARLKEYQNKDSSSINLCSRVPSL